jgi:hypothetical protein
MHSQPSDFISHSIWYCAVRRDETPVLTLKKWVHGEPVVANDKAAPIAKENFSDTSEQSKSSVERHMRTNLSANVFCFSVAMILLAQTATMRASSFGITFNAGAVVSLKEREDKNKTEFIAQGRRLGDIAIKYRASGKGEWESVSTAALSDPGKFAGTNSEHEVTYQITNGLAGSLEIKIHFGIERDALLWNLTLENQTAQPLEIGDLALPLPISRGGGQRGGGGASSPVILKHSFISGNGSFLFWMRSDSAAPYLTMVPDANTALEYWDNQGGFGGGGGRGYSVYIHSAAAGAIAKEHGTKWRQPNTSLALAPKGKRGDSQTYGFKFRFANDYDDVRQILVDEGGIDSQIVPGMTVPINLFAELALRTREKISSVEAEFPKQTKIESLGTKGDTHLFKVQFAKLGENELMVHYGKDRVMRLEFFSTEPLETLIKKRGAFLARSQHHDTNKWYNGLITDWNMDAQKLISPDDYAPIPRGRVYAVTCDDPGLGKPAFLAAKNAEFPVQSEVEALDYYIEHFVWGGLQRTTDEKYSYAIYGIPNWKVNRDSTDPGRNGQLHIWREYDYPHIIQMYFAMYRLAKNHPEIKTAMTAKEYLERAYGTANAFFTIPHEVWNGWSPWGTGFYNELVIVDLIDELELTGMKTEAGTLRNFWERKVKNFVNRDQDLFRSEYAFDSTGFESTHAFAKYAMLHADKLGETNSGIPIANAKKFLDTQITANIFCRGWLEPAYYYLGSDYRGGGGNGYVLTYMSQMGGWGVLDYALNFTTNPAPYLRLGYASYLSAWALMNTGTPESNYGYWYPGAANDGGAGGGFEPAAFGQTWLGQPHHRGSWYFSSEIDLGYCGALRTAATILADDPIFGRFCFGGDWRKTRANIEVIPKDGLRRRFHAMLNDTKLDLILDNDRFASEQPIALKENLSEIRFQLESDNPARHVAKLRLSLPAGKYSVRSGERTIASVESKDGQENIIDLPLDSRARPAVFTFAKER